MRAGTRRWGGIVGLAAVLALVSGAQASASTFSYRAPAATKSEVKHVFSGGGLTLVANCTQLLGTHLNVGARSSSDDATIHFDAQSNTGSGDEVLYGEEDDFDKGKSHEVPLTAVVRTSSVGRIVYSGDHTIVTIDYIAEHTNVPGSKDCLFAGVAQVERRATVKGIFFRSEVDDPQEPIFKAAGMRLAASCGTFSGPYISLTAKSLTGGAATAYSSRSDTDSNDTAEAFYGAADHLGKGDSALIMAFPLFPGEEFLTSRSTSGQIVFGSRKSVVAIDFLADAFSPSTCLLAGNARVAPKGSPNRVRFVKNQDVLPDKAVFTGGGLQLRSSCAAAAPSTHLLARSVGNGNASIHFGEQSDVGANGSDEDDYAEIDDMDDILYDFTLFLAGGENATGQLVYANPGPSVVAFDYLIDEGGAFGKPCALVGAAAGG